MNALETEVLKVIGESTTSPDVFTDDATGMAQIRDSISHGIQQYCMVTGSHHVRYFLPLRESCQFYRLGWERDHFGYVVGAWDRSRHTRLTQTDLVRLANDDPWWMKNTGYPEQYIQIGYDTIAVYRKPSASNLVLELDCVAIPEVYAADSDPVKMRPNFDRAVVQFAVSEFFASRGDARRATEWINSSLETVGLRRLNIDTIERQYQFGGQKKPWSPSTSP